MFLCFITLSEFRDDLGGPDVLETQEVELEKEEMFCEQEVMQVNKHIANSGRAQKI